MKKIIQFLKESKVELSKVIWPTKKETIHLTLIVIAIVLFVAIIIGLFDLGIYKGMQELLLKFK